MQQVVGGRARRVADAAEQVRGEHDGDRDAVRAARGAEQLRGEQPEGEEGDARGGHGGARDERSVHVESRADERQRHEQAERDVREHAVHHGRGRRRDPARRGGGDVLGAALLLLHAGVPHGEERAHQAAHQREPREEQEEREGAVVDAVRRAAEHEDRSRGDGDAEDLAPIALVAIGVEHRAHGGVGEQGRADDPERQLQPVAAEALPEQHEESGHDRGACPSVANSSP